MYKSWVLWKKKIHAQDAHQLFLSWNYYNVFQDRFHWGHYFSLKKISLQAPLQAENETSCEKSPGRALLETDDIQEVLDTSLCEQRFLCCRLIQWPAGKIPNNAFMGCHRAFPLSYLPHACPVSLQTKLSIIYFLLSTFKQKVEKICWLESMKGEIKKKKKKD